MVMSFRVVVGDSSKGPPDDRAWFGADQRGRYTTLRGTTPLRSAYGMAKMTEIGKMYVDNTSNEPLIGDPRMYLANTSPTINITMMARAPAPT